MFRLFEAEESGRKVLVARGHLDAWSAWRLKRLLVGRPAGAVTVLDLTQVTADSDAGLALLAHGLRAIEARGRSLVWRGLAPHHARVLQYLCAMRANLGAAHEVRRLG